MIVAALLIALATYLAAGLLFAIPFVLFGARRIDSHAQHASWGFKLLVFPGVMTFWPLLLKRWVGGVQEPPDESNAHRHAAHTAP